jgi:hypothetical protein
VAAWQPPGESHEAAFPGGRIGCREERGWLWWLRIKSDVLSDCHGVAAPAAAFRRNRIAAGETFAPREIWRAPDRMAGAETRKPNADAVAG